MSLEEWMWKWDLFSPVEWIMSCWGPQANISNLPQGTSSKILFWFQKDHACLLANSECAFKLYFFSSPGSIHWRLSELAVCENGLFPRASEGRPKEVRPFYLTRLSQRWLRWTKYRLPGMYHMLGSIPTLVTSVTPDTLVWQGCVLAIF